ncbi:hypothetical protein DL93DRAFT_2174292 [Clavulina sp. PMI_390]|nr:hypothetical protein DL93DRAFT_2174445 [Clavulina sp. PMI_390]KAF8289111.1 hypothetical protein DL93DRAFT_2174292 [Clavulina sp. PMI_390]
MVSPNAQPPALAQGSGTTAGPRAMARKRIHDAARRFPPSDSVPLPQNDSVPARYSQD